MQGRVAQRRSFPFLNRDARVIPDLVAKAGERVEESGFAAVLGLPVTAMRKVSSPRGSGNRERDETVTDMLASAEPGLLPEQRDLPGLVFPEAQVVTANFYINGIAQRGESNDTKQCAGSQTHLRETPANAGIPGQVLDPALLTCLQAVQRRGRFHAPQRLACQSLVGRSSGACQRDWLDEDGLGQSPADAETAFSHFADQGIVVGDYFNLPTFEDAAAHAGVVAAAHPLERSESKPVCRAGSQSLEV